MDEQTVQDTDDQDTDERKIIDWLGIQPDDFNLKNSQFAHESHMHGIAHVYRTMINVLWLAWLRGDAENGRLAFFGAYVHDLARVHDGCSATHGADSVRWVMPLYESLFASYGVGKRQNEFIQEAVRQHAYRETLGSKEPGWLVLAMLKDADALDRCRLGDLDVQYLRLPESLQVVEPAERRFEVTGFASDECSFIDFIDRCYLS